MALKEPGRHSLGGGRFQPWYGVKDSFLLKHWRFIFFSTSLPKDIRLLSVAYQGVCCCRLDKMADDTDR